MAGDAAAQAHVALAYLHGEGVPAHLGEAVRWFERAALQGHPEAMVQLAKLALQGQSTGAAMAGPELERGRSWAKRAAEAGSLEGQLLLANLLLFGPAGQRDLGKAAALFRQAAASGSAAGSFGLALALLQGDPEAQAAPGEIVALIESAAAQGLPMAVYLAGVVSECGFGTAPDLSTALALYRRAAELGVRAAQTRLGFALLRGSGKMQNEHAGETWLRKAARAGDAAAAALVGEIYAGGGALPANLAEAEMWFSRARSLGWAPGTVLAPSDDPAMLIGTCLQVTRICASEHGSMPVED